MATFGEIKSRLADDFNRSDLTSQIANEILRAIKHYERTRFWFNEAQATTTMVASQYNYSLPSDILFLDFVEVTVNSHRYKLCEITWEEYVDIWRNGTSTTGAPDDYSTYADQIWVGPAPDSTYTMTVNYVKSLTTLSADADSNAWTTYAEDLIASRAGKIIALRTIKSESDAATYAVLEREALNALYTQNDQRLITGRMRYNG
jgi:hypothetical protein